MNKLRGGWEKVLKRAALLHPSEDLPIYFLCSHIYFTGFGFSYLWPSFLGGLEEVKRQVLATTYQPGAPRKVWRTLERGDVDRYAKKHARSHRQTGALRCSNFWQIIQSSSRTLGSSLSLWQEPVSRDAVRILRCGKPTSILLFSLWVGSKQGFPSSGTSRTF